MKILTTGAICVLLNVCYLHSSAQNLPVNEPGESKPRLFADMPEKMHVHISDLESLLSLPVGTNVNTFLSREFHFQGTIVSVSDVASTKVKSVVIKSINKKGATFNFTRIIKADGTIKYLGRIISFTNSDAFELVKENDQYILQKKNLNDIMTE